MAESDQFQTGVIRGAGRKPRARRVRPFGFTGPALALLAFFTLGLTAAAGPEGGDEAALEPSITALVNRERQERGLAPLAPEPGLNALARRQARSMAAKGYFSHVDSEGLSPDGRRTRYDPGLCVTGYAENIVAVGGKGGDPVPARCVQCWMESPGHRANILDQAFTHTGVGTARSLDGRTVAVQVFATPLARLDAVVPGSPFRNGILKLEFTYLGPPDLRRPLRVFVTLPDPLARHYVSGGVCFQGVAYLVPSWRGDRFSVRLPARYGAGAYRVGLGTRTGHYPPFYTVRVR